MAKYTKVLKLTIKTEFGDKNCDNLSLINKLIKIKLCCVNPKYSF